MRILVVWRSPLSHVPAQQAGFPSHVGGVDRGIYHLKYANFLNDDVVCVVVAEVAVGHVNPDFACEEVGCDKDDERSVVEVSFKCMLQAEDVPRGDPFSCLCHSTIQPLLKDFQAPFDE